MTDHGNWRRPSKCANTECVEVFRDPTETSGQVFVRDSKHPAIILEFTREEWAAFRDAVKAGEYDELAGP